MTANKIVNEVDSILGYEPTFKKKEAKEGANSSTDTRRSQAVSKRPKKLRASVSRASVHSGSSRAMSAKKVDVEDVDFHELFNRELTANKPKQKSSRKQL